MSQLLDGGKPYAKSIFKQTNICDTDWMPHINAIKHGATEYIAYLRNTASSTASPSTAKAATGIADAIQAALNGSTTIATPISAREIAQCATIELLNPWVVGLGNPDSEIVIVGTEPAYDLVKGSVNYTLESCYIHLLWLLNDNGVHASQLAATSLSIGFQRYPNDLYGVTNLAHTWGRLSALLAKIVPKANARTLLSKKLLEANGSRVFDHCYLFDLSSHPARRQAQGSAHLSQTRIDFVATLLKELDSAKYLVFHGRPNDQNWNKTRFDLADQFLGQASGTFMKMHEVDTPVPGEATIQSYEANGRRVLITHALTDAVNAEYWGRVAGLCQ